MRPRPPRVRGALSSTCRVPACHTPVASQSLGREQSRWMPIFHMRQWRQVSACPDAPCGSSTVMAEQLTQKTLGSLGLMWPRNIRCGDTARCAAMDANTRAFSMWSSAGTQMPQALPSQGVCSKCRHRHNTGSSKLPETCGQHSCLCLAGL